MKRILILIFTVVITLNISTTAFAIDVFYQNKKVEMDVQPKVVNGSTLVPIRAINTALKGETKWNQSKQQVEIVKDGHKIILEIGKNSALVDAKVVNLITPAQVISNRTYVPLRFISEYFGHDVIWDSATQSILIDTDIAIIDKQANISTHFDTIIDINSIDFGKIYEVNGTGKYSDYKKLIGYPYENHYSIYYTGNSSSYSVTYEDLKPKDLKEKISWIYDGKTYTHTRSQLYSFFSDITTLERLLGQNDGIINQNWLAKTFGETYQDWFTQGLYSQEATRIVDRYLEVKEGINIMDRDPFNYIDLENIEPNEWISLKEFHMNSEGMDFSAHAKRVGDKTVLIMAFSIISPLTGTVEKVIYEVPDMPIDYLDNEKDIETTFNGIRFKIFNGDTYINREDLKNKGIL
ncbi:stalk domain-containing protein [Lysinibacillus fusiformis]|uniref:stalk domain-containing protein n=1 Tax=Lysinibacillus fusiformis TaxID=28031 RepID=UPI001EF67626|nr:stalk domain-containing protein [Lysinibacillus fusiformis]MCG7435196.1 copper amine oxidase N-terminal domain-containing protein [Lysinibacillus fusiformis]